MLNEALGTRKSVLGRTVIETNPDARGHAVYGPYVYLAAGDYCVQFGVAPAQALEVEDDRVLAILDVVTDFGKSNLASRPLKASDIRNGREILPLRFRVDEPSIAEFRVGVLGEAALEIDEHVALTGADDDEIRRGRFPEVTPASPAFLRERLDYFRHVFERGFAVEVRGDDLLMTKDGITFFANSHDDINLVAEIFVERVYRFETKRPTVVIDIGMNLGLVAMQFAQNPAVRRVYSFEPFPSTYARGMANLSLNQDLAAKIVPSNTGIGDVEGRVVMRVVDTDDSGSRATRDVGEEGVEIELEMARASIAVARIIDAEPDCDIVLKIDCEGAEFAIFEELRRGGIIGRVSAFMVEWHAMFAGKSQRDLIAPLRDAGFMVFDRSPPQGNGFFYAVQTGTVARQSLMT